MAMNVVHQNLATFGGGRYAVRRESERRFGPGGSVVDAGKPDHGGAIIDLDTGTVFASFGVGHRTAVRESFALEVTDAETRVWRFDGKTFTFPKEFLFVEHVDALLTGGAPPRVGDPTTGHSLTLAGLTEEDAVEVRWADAPHSRLAVRTGRTEGEGLAAFVRVLQFPSGTRALEVKLSPSVAPARGSLVSHPDGTYLAWDETDATSPARPRVRFAIADLATGKVVRTSTFTDARPPEATGFEGDHLLLARYEADGVRVSARTGLLVTSRPRAVLPQPQGTPMDRRAFAVERTKVLAESPELDRFSPVLLDTALYQAKHGYEVIELGNTKMLVRRGTDYLLCDPVRGEGCAKIFTSESTLLQKQFSASGRNLAVCTDLWAAIFDVESGRRRWSSEDRRP